MPLGSPSNPDTLSEVLDASHPPLAAFPLSYVLHIGEEAWGGETFPVWASRLSGASFTREEFIVLNSVALTVMCIASAVAFRRPQARPIAFLY